MRLDALYQQVILDHYRQPHGRGLRDPFDAEVSHRNPTCGDELTLRVKVAGDRVTDVSYAAQGCSISQASASVLHDLVSGVPLAQAASVSAAFTAMLRGSTPDEATAELLDDAAAFAGVAQYPMRVKCAMLAWTALRDALIRAGAGDLTERLRDQTDVPDRTDAPDDQTGTTDQTSTSRGTR